MSAASAATRSNSAVTLASSLSMRARRSSWPRAAFSSSLRRAVRSASAVVIWSKVCFGRRHLGVGGGDALVDAGAALARSRRLRARGRPARRAGARSRPRRRPRASARARCPPSSCTIRRSSSAMRSLARASSRSSVSRAITRRCRAAASFASASRSAGSAAAASACCVAASACAPVRSATTRMLTSLACSASATSAVALTKRRW